MSTIAVTHCSPFCSISSCPWLFSIPSPHHGSCVEPLCLHHFPLDLSLWNIMRDCCVQSLFHWGASSGKALLHPSHYNPCPSSCKGCSWVRWLALVCPAVARARKTKLMGEYPDYKEFCLGESQIMNVYHPKEMLFTYSTFPTWISFYLSESYFILAFRHSSNPIMSFKLF